MDWFLQFSSSQPVAFAILILAGVAILGLSLGSLKLRNVSLGISGVLFSGILFGHLGLRIEPNILIFARDFGLTIFVYTIGMQVGPGFFGSLRKQGLSLNLMAISVVLLGTILAWGLSKFSQVPISTMVGILSGATTNTPALGAAQEVLRNLSKGNPGLMELPVLGYAVAYPFGVVGVILSILLLRFLFRINLQKEVEDFNQKHQTPRDLVTNLNILVNNKNLEGLKLKDIPGVQELGVVISRIKSKDEEGIHLASPETTIHCGDILHAVGPFPNLEKFKLIIGEKSDLDIAKVPGPVLRQRVIVTRKEVIGKTLAELHLRQKFDVNISRVTRADIEMTAVSGFKLQFGDMVMVVGEKEDIANAAQFLGNSLKDINHTNFIPIFFGLFMGILIGTYPFTITGAPVPLRLGLAGGPLLAAIILSRIGKIGPLVWYMPVNANIALRELGITLFLSCVGLKAGEKFLELLTSGQGLVWMAYGAVITIVPLLVVGLVARLIFKVNYISLSGLLAGSMTDPPALQFTTAMTDSNAPAVAYATVYPLSTFLRIVLAQVLLIISWVS